MAALAQRNLAQLTGSGSTIRFELPPVNATVGMATATRIGTKKASGVNTNCAEETTTGVIRLSAIKVIETGILLIYVKCWDFTLETWKLLSGEIFDVHARLQSLMINSFVFFIRRTLLQES